MNSGSGLSPATRLEHSVQVVELDALRGLVGAARDVEAAGSDGAVGLLLDDDGVAVHGGEGGLAAGGDVGLDALTLFVSLPPSPKDSRKCGCLAITY